MELTKLQRIGIGYLLLQAKEMNPWMKQGTIKFSKNYKGKFINMMVKEYRTEYRFVFTLNDDENISENIVYEYIYDSTNNFFRIVTMEERNGVA